MGGSSSCGHSPSYVQHQLNAQRQAEIARQNQIAAGYQRQIQQLEIERKRKEEQSRQKTINPQEYQSVAKNVQQKFVDSINTLRFSQFINPKIGTHICFIGPTSTGKSSLLNALFGLNLPIGLGSVTSQATKVYQSNGKSYWDSPGINKDFGFYKQSHLNFFNDIDLIFVLFANEVYSVDLILKIFMKMNKRVILVRTKCDTWNASHSKTLDQELQNDLKQGRLINPQIQRVIGVGKDTYQNIRPYL